MEELKLRGQHTDDQFEISRLKDKLREKAAMIETEKSNIEAIRNSFAERLRDREKLENQLLKNSAVVPQKTDNTAADANSHAKIQNLRKQVKRLREEVAKLKDKAREEEDKMAKLSQVKAQRDSETRAMLSNQIKDQKVIARLKKDKQELLDKIEEMKVEAVKKPVLSRKSSIRAKPKELLYLVKGTSIFFEGDKPVEKKEEPVEEVVVEESKGEENLAQLVKICLNKRIDLKRHLRRYDINSLNKITAADFSRAVDELKIGFIDKEIEKIAAIFKDSEQFVSIEEFIKKTVELEPSYAEIVLEHGD